MASNMEIEFFSHILKSIRVNYSMHVTNAHGEDLTALLYERFYRVTVVLKATMLC
jgi:hypothetical protein